MRLRSPHRPGPRRPRPAPCPPQPFQTPAPSSLSRSESASSISPVRWGAEPEDKLKKFWLPITGVDGGPAGYIETSMELVPAEAARTQKAGFGRSEPNANPKLPNPTGRISLSLNPLKML